MFKCPDILSPNIFLHKQVKNNKQMYIVWQDTIISCISVGNPTPKGPESRSAETRQGVKIGSISFVVTKKHLFDF